MNEDNNKQDKKEAIKLIKTYEDLNQKPSKHKEKIQDSSAANYIHKTYTTYIKDPTLYFLFRTIPGFFIYVGGSFLIRSPMTIIDQSECRKAIELHGYHLTFNQRKNFVVYSTCIATVLHCKRYRNNLLICFFAYYVGLSLLFCRENLNPYI